MAARGLELLGSISSEVRGVIDVELIKVILREMERTSPPTNCSSTPNSSFALSMSHSAASKQSSGPAGNGFSGANL